MYYDDDFDNDYDSDPDNSGSGFDLSNDQGEAERNLDPLNLRDPESSYLFLSDDAQDELTNPQNRKLKCLLCQHEFLGRDLDDLERLKADYGL
ncbi:MAG: hypothetical protein KJ573_08305 [Proteobacteria bacterium]|nr:hypothetical protein [Desulfobacterales bacterium]MBU0734175.1 hypothetical protein [Pseudomonadota bacterium]MBU1903579.1 hypothetical protein [Pseudomonadota bacterium]